MERKIIPNLNNTSMKIINISLISRSDRLTNHKHIFERDKEKWMKEIKYPKILATVKFYKLNQKMQSFKLYSNHLTQLSNSFKANNRASFISQLAMPNKNRTLNQFMIPHKVNRLKNNLLVLNHNKITKKCISRINYK